jgi:DNA polymerase I
VTNLSNVVALPFAEIWAEDFEWVPKLGERHDVVCYGARELRSGRTLKLWRDQLGPTSPNRTDDQALFLSFVFNAEGASRLSLGWQLPAKVIDLSPLFRRVVNGRIAPQGKGLLGALAYYGILRSTRSTKKKSESSSCADGLSRRRKKRKFSNT